MTRHVYYGLPFYSVGETAWLSAKFGRKSAVRFGCQRSLLTSTAIRRQLSLLRLMLSDVKNLWFKPKSFPPVFFFFNTKQTGRLRHRTLIDMAQLRLWHYGLTKQGVLRVVAMNGNDTLFFPHVRKQSWEQIQLSACALQQ